MRAHTTSPRKVATSFLTSLAGILCVLAFCSRALADEAETARDPRESAQPAGAALESLLQRLTATPTADRVKSLARECIAVRSIVASDEDFSDLEPLATALRDRRFVLMSELTHRDGATFNARARLVRFLHQRLVYDVVCDEYDPLACDQLYRAMNDPILYEQFFSDERNRKFTETRFACQRPLLDYIQSTQSSAIR